MALGAAAPSVIPRRRDALHIAHGANLEGPTLIFDETQFHLGASEKMRSVFLESAAPYAGVRSRAAIGHSRQLDPCRKTGPPPAYSSAAAPYPPAAGIAPGPQHRAELPGNLAQWPATARQQSHRLSLKLIRELSTRRTHPTPFQLPQELIKGCPPFRGRVTSRRTPNIDIAARRQIALLPPLIRVFPLAFEPRDHCRREVWRVLAKQGRENLVEIAGRNPVQIESRQESVETLRSPRPFW
jgi:hypothetical protein